MYWILSVPRSPRRWTLPGLPAIKEYAIPYPSLNVTSGGQWSYGNRYPCLCLCLHVLCLKKGLLSFTCWPVMPSTCSKSSQVPHCSRLVTSLPLSQCNTVILTIVYWLSKAVHFVARHKLHKACETADQVLNALCYILGATVSLSSGFVLWCVSTSNPTPPPWSSQLAWTEYADNP